MLNVLDLFAGIGGFSLGLERTGGFRTVAFCEIDKKAQRVLNKHWPDTPIFDDVSALTKDLIDETVGTPVHVITGGFPCQDISLAGKGAGLEGERSGLWFQFHRLIREFQPRYAVIENVSALRTKGLEVVLQGLSEIGYDAEWHCIPASAVGAPHRRDRIWIVAYPRQLRGRWVEPQQGSYRGNAVASGYGPQGNVGDVAYARCQPSQVSVARRLAAIQVPQRHSWWQVEPSVGRMADGVPSRMDRLKQLGNAVVPQIPQLLGEAILDWEKTRAAA